jgi:hypothetical protein
MIGANITSVSQDLYDLALLALQDTNEQVKSQDIQGLYPDNESLGSAAIIDFVQTEDGIELWVEISTLSGETLQIRLIDLANR